MRKPNLALKLTASAIQYQSKAMKAKTRALRAFYEKKANALMVRAAKCADAQAAVRIITASNKAAAKKVKADFDDVDDVDVVDVEADECAIDDVELDSDMVDVADDMSDIDGVYASDEDEDDEDEDEDDEDEDEDEEVDSAVQRILSRRRAAKRMSASARVKQLQAKLRRRA